MERRRDSAEGDKEGLRVRRRRRDGKEEGNCSIRGALQNAQYLGHLSGNYSEHNGKQMKRN